MIELDLLKLEGLKHHSTLAGGKGRVGAESRDRQRGEKGRETSAQDKRCGGGIEA